MRWIAPPQKNHGTATLEERLWAAADQLRANSGLTSQQYSQPVLGLIFLRFADARFTAVRKRLQGAAKGGRRRPRIDDPKAYTAEGVIYLPPEARYDHLLSLPEGCGVGKKLNEAMQAIERANEPLKDVLPKTYQIFDGKLLKDLLKKGLGDPGRPRLRRLRSDLRVLPRRVRLMVEALEPYHGKILDPACGSGGMFVSARFVADTGRTRPLSSRFMGRSKWARQRDSAG